MESSKAPTIKIIEEEYEIPQLNRTRRIAALLPHHYDESDQKFPVLYLHYGQNLFDEHAPFGNWAIDKSLETLAQEGHQDLVVITIDHGGDERAMEYSPYHSSRLGRGNGHKYLAFLKQTLKPYVDSHFRVLSDRENTGIGGSSMGGLISLYAGLKESDLFGKLLIFSPSLWVSPKIFYHARTFVPNKPTALYLYAGGKESHYHLPNVLKLKASLLKRGYDYSKLRFNLSIDPEGAHGEGFWAAEFPNAIKWLYYPNAD